MDTLKDNPAPSCFVMVRARPAGESVKVTVRDKGYGISTENLPWLFERFFVAPAPRLFSTPNFPPCVSMMPREIARPSPRSLGLEAFTFTLPAAEWENKQ